MPVRPLNGAALAAALSLLVLSHPGEASAAPPPAAPVPPQATAPAEPPPLLRAMRLELDRSMARLRLRGYEAPYFISYTLRDLESNEVIGKYGAVYGKGHERRRVIHVEVRVGGY